MKFEQVAETISFVSCSTRDTPPHYLCIMTLEETGKHHLVPKYTQIQRKSDIERISSIVWRYGPILGNDSFEIWTEKQICITGEKVEEAQNLRTPKSGSFLVIVFSCPLIGFLSSSTANQRVAQNNQYTLYRAGLQTSRICIS